MHQEILMAGAGGDGIMLIGQLLAHAAVNEGKNIVWFPSYGPESRGGSAECTVILSTDEIGSPIMSSPNTLIAFNQIQLDKFAPNVKSGGLIILNSSLATAPKDRTDCTILSVPAGELAEQAGNIRAANMVMLGRYVSASNAVTLESVIKALPEVLPPHRQDRKSVV
jgi:2-oxoglutarate ferredoxin oxidoreductase subunit gamma